MGGENKEEVYMNKVLATAVFGAVFAVAGLAANVAFYGSTAHAAEACTNGTKYTDFEGQRDGNTLTIWTKGNKPLCKDVNVNFSSYEILNKNYNGKPFKDNPTAIPQQSIYNKTVTLKKGTNGKTTETVKAPNACTPYQIDAYVGPVQTKITTLEGLVGTNAIVGKVFDKTKDNCDTPAPKDVKVCNPANGQIITVKETEASKYKPVDDEACKDVKVCDLNSGKIITIKGYQYDSKQYSKDLNNNAKCKPVTPSKINVCVIESKEIIEIDDNKFDSTTQTKDLSKCEETPTTPETPQTPSTPETPEVLPSTGPAEAISALFGTGSLAGAVTAYVRSRRALKN